MNNMLRRTVRNNKNQMNKIEKKIIVNYLENYKRVEVLGSWPYLKMRTCFLGNFNTEVNLLDKKSRDNNVITSP